MAGARQIRIPGTEEKVDEEIAKLGAVFAKAGNKAKKAGEAKKDACSALVAAMLRKKVTIYRDLEADPPISINLSDPKYTVTVKTINQPDAPEDVATQAPAKA
jgi:hypothetical protein